MNLRPYQQDAVDRIRALYAAGTKRVLLHLATGGGKTVVFSYILKSLAARGKSALMVVHGRHLVDQAAARLEREGVPHGIIMNGRETALNRPVYVCSIDTLRARGITPKADLIVIDEAHMAVSKGYREFLAAYPAAFLLPVTATPFTKESMRHMADAIVAPTTIGGLIAEGWLVRPRYVVPVKHDLSSIKITASTGDYNQGDLAEFMGKSSIVGDLVANWLKFGDSRPTLCFAPTIATSLRFVESCRNAGISAEHVEANTPERDRHEALGRLERGETKILSNVGIFCTGVDLPFVSCILLYRPTKSLNLYIQQCGRGTRPSLGKSDFIILDHGNNVREHGFIDAEHEIFLDGTPKTKRAECDIWVCGGCFAALPGSSAKCPYCDFIEEKSARVIDHEDGELAEVLVDDADILVITCLQELKRIQKARGYKHGWIFHELKNRFGEEAAKKHHPQKFVPPWVRRKLTANS